jgi:hypothetical protein
MRLALGMVVLSGCRIVEGSGVSAEETRQVDSFAGVANATQVKVSVVPGDDASVVVRCDDNLLDLVETRVDGDWLEIRTPNNTSIHPHTSCGVDITARALRGLESSGSGDTIAEGEWRDLEDVSSSGSGELRAIGWLPALSSIDSSGSGGVIVDGIESGDVWIDNSGSGGIEAIGTAHRVSIDSSGSGGIDAMGVDAIDGEVDSSGSGNVRLTATGHVTVDLSGSGNVVVAGGASTDVDDSGSGEVVER